MGHWYTLSRISMNDVVSAIDAEIARMEQARNLLAETGTRKRGKKPSTKTENKPKRTMSPAARKKIAAAQRKRWAAVRRAAK